MRKVRKMAACVSATGAMMGGIVAMPASAAQTPAKAPAATVAKPAAPAAAKKVVVPKPPPPRSAYKPGQLKK